MSVIQTASVTGALSAMLGCEVGELPAGAVRKRNIIPQCADCSKAQDGGTHPCWTSLRIEPLNKAVFQWFIGLSNALKAQLRRAQVLNWLNDRMCNGIPFDPSHPDTDYQPPGAAMPISMFRGWWEVVSASGRTVVLRWHTGEFDPNDIQWTLTTTRTVDDDGFPLAEPISTSVTTHCKLPLGILRLGEASQLRDHAGWIITGYSFPEPIVDGDLI